MQIFRLEYQTPKDECKHECKFIYQNLPVFDETTKWFFNRIGYKL